jgi:hypothetical protein
MRLRANVPRRRGTAVLPKFGASTRVLRWEVPQVTNAGKILKFYGISLAVVTCFPCSWIFFEVNFTTRISTCGGSIAIN